MTSTPLRPIAIDIPQAKLDRIRAKLADMQWPEAPADDGNRRYGVDVKYLRTLVDYWIASYDWRKAESELNHYPHFKAAVNDTEIHFVHVRGSGDRPFPLILTHGWPGSFMSTTR